MDSQKNLPQVADKRKQDGASLVEYALLVALIAIVAIVALRSLGNQVSGSFSSINSGLASASN